MDSNSVAPLPEMMAPMAEFDKSPPSPPETPPLTSTIDDLPPPPASVSIPASVTASEPTTTTPAVPSEKLIAEKQHRYEEDNNWVCVNWFEYMLVVVLASLLLLGALTVTIFWVLFYHNGFAWRENPSLQFNLHPVLMVAGFISFSGFSMLLYRICRCCRRLHVKLFHTIFHAISIPCIVVGFMAVYDWHSLSNPPVPHFYSLHSWLGLVTMGLFALQFVVGFFSFLILLCCEGATSAFRAAMIPIHASFGITTFMLAVATCLTGLLEKAVDNFGSVKYSGLPEEAIVMNALAMVLIALGILLSYAVRREWFRVEVKTFVTERL